MNWEHREEKMGKTSLTFLACFSRTDHSDLWTWLWLASFGPWDDLVHVDCHLKENGRSALVKNFFGMLWCGRTSHGEMRMKCSMKRICAQQIDCWPNRKKKYWEILSIRIGDLNFGTRFSERFCQIESEFEGNIGDTFYYTAMWNCYIGSMKILQEWIEGDLRWVYRGEEGEI